MHAAHTRTESTPLSLMIMTLARLLRRSVQPLLLLAALSLTQSALAAPDDCFENAPDGEAICQEPQITPYRFDLCEEIAPFLSRYGAYCQAFYDGTPAICPDGSGGCCNNKNVDAPQLGNLLGRAQTMAGLLCGTLTHFAAAQS